MACLSRLGCRDIRRDRAGFKLGDGHFKPRNASIGERRRQRPRRSRQHAEPDDGSPYRPSLHALEMFDAVPSPVAPCPALPFAPSTTSGEAEAGNIARRAM
jgi:hypothetical protein